MILFRTLTGKILTREPGHQYYVDDDIRRQECLGPLYVGADGKPYDRAGNLIDGEVLTKFWYTIPEYLALYPEWHWLATEVRREGIESMLVQTYPNWSCMPGCVWTVDYWPAFKHPVNTKYSTPATVLLNDGDDFYSRKTFATDAAAKQGFEELKELAPFHINELDAFGYERE